MRKYRLAWVIWLMLVIVGCGGSQSDTLSGASSYGDAAADEMASDGLLNFEDGHITVSQDAPTELDLNRGERQQTQQRLIIKTGNMIVDVNDIDVAIEDAIQLVTGLGGYIVSQSVSGYDHYRSGALTFGVPVDQFENVMSQLRGFGRVVSDSATGQDVTEQYVDLNSRMTNLIATQERMRALLEEARNVEETLEVDRELRRIEEEMNVIQGRIQFLAESAAFSTITVDFSAQGEETVPEPGTFNIGRTAQSALVQLRDTVLQVTDGLVYFGIVCGPWLLMLLLIGWVARGVVRRVRGRDEEAAVSAETVLSNTESDAPAA